MTNAEILEKLEAALKLIQEAEAGMDDRSDLDDVQSKLCNDVSPVIGALVDEVAYNRPEPFRARDMGMGG